jgi:4-hydroxyphenylpyruvate dioxygenase-like putative hemolysin
MNEFSREPERRIKPFDEMSRRLVGSLSEVVRGCQGDNPGQFRERLAALAAAAQMDGLSPRFAQGLVELVFDEQERRVGAQARSPDAGGDRSALSESAIRIDHVAIAVPDLDAAIDTLRARFGFEVIERRRVRGEISGMFSATLRAGGVTLVLCQGDSDKSNVSRYIAAYGPGVQHLAIEVGGLPQVVDDLEQRRADLLTGIIRGPGLDQAFTRRDLSTGMQFEFVARSSNEEFDDQNVKELFAAMERDDVY